MRRMYTTQGIQKLIDDSIDDAFENISDEEIGSGLFEKIKDKDGHERFIEGEGNTSASSNNFTPSYAKWSLCGTHLMVVLAGSITGVTSISQANIRSNIVLPSWMVNKIYPRTSEDNTIYRKTEELVSSNGIKVADITFTFDKQADGVAIINIGTITELTESETYYLRIQFDLLIDNDSE